MTRFILILLVFLGGCAAPQPENPRSTQAAEFRPSLHGFKFVNRFEGSPLPASLRDPSTPLGAMLGGPAGRNIPSTFGLCGGMSLTAADNYIAGVPMPSDIQPPASGTPLYEHLYQRQVESLGDGAIMAMAFWQWMNLPDRPFPGSATETTATLTGRELPGILARLARGELVPLGLVLVRARSNAHAPDSRAGQLWNNHQVVAYGAVSRDGLQDLRIYDPNYPDDDGVVIRLRPLEGVQHAFLAERVTGAGRTSRVRGIFPMPYTAAPPFGTDHRAP